MSFFQAIQIVLVGVLLLAAYRLIRGPTLPDRVIALDFIAVIVVALSSIHAIVTGAQGFLDIAIVVAVFSFLSTVGFAWFLEHREGNDG